MEVKSVIIEILRDYNYNVEHGMSQNQALEVLRAMLIDMVEYEKQLTYDLGVNAGQYGVLWDLKTKGPEYVLATYLKDGSPVYNAPRS